MPKKTVDFSPQVKEMLTTLSKAEGRTKTEIMRRCLGLYAYLHKEGPGNGGTHIAILGPEDKILRKVKWF